MARRHPPHQIAGPGGLPGDAMRLLFAIALLPALLQGCTYSTVRPIGPMVQLQPPPSAPLRASLLFSANSGSNALVDKTIRGSRYFAAVDATTTAATDVEIVFHGNECGSRKKGLMDSPVAFIAAPVVGLVGMATLLSVPLVNAGQWDCHRRFSYRLLRDPAGSPQTLFHGYRHTDYRATLGYPLLTSRRRAQYQGERSIDDAVAALFNRISADVAAREAWQ